MSPIVAIALGPIVLVLAGLAILWAQHRTRPFPPNAQPSLLASVLAALGWVMLILGSFAVIGLMANVLFLIAWIAAAVVLLAALNHYRNMEKRSLLWVLMIAAERGIPLESAARAFAEERNDYLGRRALDLADYLEAGLPLSLALERSRFAVAPAILLAADLGQQTGSLGPALRQVIQRSEQTDAVLRTSTEKLFYLAVVVLLGLCTWGFIMIKIVPAFEKIFKDFGIALPSATKALIGVSRLSMQAWPLIVPVLAVLLFLLTWATLYYLGMPPRFLRGLNVISKRADSAVVLRWLANAVRQDRSMSEMIRLLAGYFPQRGMRWKLEQAAKRVEQGQEWCEALRHAGLIGRAEVAVFKSAERAGNLAWALDEMAESIVRRSTYRLRAFVSAAFPAFILALGLSVLFVVLGLFTPLLTLIQRLAS